MLRRWRRASLLLLTVALLVLSPSCSGPTSPPDPAATTGPSRPVGPKNTACQGVPVAVSDDVQAVLDAHPPGTTFCLSAGTHRLGAPVVPRRGDVLQGEPGAVLSGSRILSGWRASGNTWSTAGFLPSEAGTAEFCLDSAPLCGRVEDVFLDKRRLMPVGSGSAVTPGTVHADYATNTITIGDDPGGHLLEQAVAPSLVRATVDDVTIANLVLEQAANAAQVAAVDNRREIPATSGSDWRLLDNEVRLNHGVGVGVADASTVTGNLIHRQGQLGIGVWGADSVISDNEISFNGAAGYSPEWEAGGTKNWMTERLTVTRNHVHDNFGPGLWSDGGNIDTTYSENRITGNWNAGIQHEISYDATITNNRISGNGLRHKGWAWDAGIQIQSSGGNRRIEIAHNVLTDNANGISLIDSGDRASEEPAPHGNHRVQNVWVHDNTISMLAGQSTGAVEDTGDPGIFTTNGNVFEDNTYYLQSLTAEHFAWQGADLDWDSWQGGGAGNDVGGSAQPIAGS